jgi:hypothetical protein
LEPTTSAQRLVQAFRPDYLLLNRSTRDSYTRCHGHAYIAR